MNNLTESQKRTQEHREKLAAERVAWHAAIKLELEKLGLKASPVNERCVTAFVDAKLFEASYCIEAFSPRHSYSGLAAYNRVVIGSYGRKRIWKKLDAAGVAAEVKSRVEQNKASYDSREANATMTKAFTSRKKQELKDVFPVPGVRAEIVMGNSDDAGKYILIVDQHDSALRGPWTLEQVKAILSALEAVVPSHEFRVGRQASVEMNHKLLGDGPHHGVIVEALTYRVTLRVPNPDKTGKTVWQHEDIHVALPNSTLKLVP